MKPLRDGLAALGLIFALAAGPAAAVESGVVVITTGELDQPNGAVALLDLSTVQRAGDVVTASMAIVVLDPESSRVPGLSYMVGHQRISCRERTAQMTLVEVFAAEGVKLTEFNPTDPAEPVQEGSAWGAVMERACSDASLIQPGVQPFADIATGVAAVRASVDAAATVRTEFAPHRFVLSRTSNGADGVRSSIFVDQALVEQEGERPVRWVLTAHSQPRLEGSTPVAYDLWQMTFDCQARRARVRVMLSVGADGQVATSSIELGPWSDVTPQQGRELALACGTSAPANAPTFTTIQAATAHARAASGQAPT